MSYDEAGVDDLVAQLKDLKPAGVITESTGGLELPLVAALAAASLPVAVVNPRQVRNFAKSTDRLAKTDRLDAQVLAHFGEAVRPPMRPLRDDDTLALGAVLARRRQVVDILVAEKNRLDRATLEVRPRIEAHIGWLKQELDDLDTDLRQRIKRSPVWREKDDLLRSVPGVGPQVSLTLLAYLPELGTLNRRQIAAPVSRPSVEKRSISWKAFCVGWPGYSTLYAVYGSTGGESLQPGAMRLLPAVVESRKAEEGGSHCVCTEAADHPQHYGKDGCSLGADHSQALTLLKTVAFRSAVSMDGIAKQQQARRSNNGPRRRLGSLIRAEQN